MFCRFMDANLYNPRRYEGLAGAKNFSSLHVLRDLEHSVGDTLRARHDRSSLYLHEARYGAASQL